MFAFKTIIFLIFLFIINCENAKVSPKLDFTESNDENNSDEKIKSTIQGVRVVVDTSKFKKSIELKSDEEDLNDTSNNSTHKSGRKTVGIRTDITFEINDEQNDSNSTSKEKTHKHNTNNNEDVDDNDASIPIFRGTNTRHSNTNNNNNNNNFNYNDNTNNQNWNINNNRRYDNNNDNHNYNINIDNLNDHSIDIDSDEPVFHRIDDENVRHGSIDNWSNFIPINGVWTTEKYSSNIFQHNQRENQHNQFTPIKQKTWQPCYCETSSKTNGVIINSYKTPLQTRRIIDDKLDGPFSNSDK